MLGMVQLRQTGMKLTNCSSMLLRQPVLLLTRSTLQWMRPLGICPYHNLAVSPWMKHHAPLQSLLRATSSPRLSSPTSVCAYAQDQPAVEEEEAQPLEYCIVNFYHLVDISKPHAVIEQHRQYLEGKEVRGRIYISEQGINAQFGGKMDDAVAYVDWLKTQHLFQGLHYTVDPVEDHMYPRLRLKYRPNLISLAGGMAGLPVTKEEARATPLSPSAWREMLEKGAHSKKPLVLDVRNSYEWDAGHFVGAARPLEDNFNETPTEATPAEVPQYLADADPETPVMMYCTGGIRCDVYSTYLKQRGYKNLYTLEGGIQNYMKTEGLDHWNGSLYVFDGRMAVRPNKDQQEELVAAAPCHSCGGEAVLPHANCANIDCNKLFIACDNCKVEYKGCCCSDCMEAPRLLRPMKPKGIYGNWSQYAENVPKGPEGSRISRRRKRQQALREKEQEKRAERMERRQLVKQVLGNMDAPSSGDGEQGATSDRLQELRARLAARKKEQMA